MYVLWFMIERLQFLHLFNHALYFILISKHSKNAIHSPSLSLTLWFFVRFSGDFKVFGTENKFHESYTLEFAKRKEEKKIICMYTYIYKHNSNPNKNNVCNTE